MMNDISPCPFDGETTISKIRIKKILKLLKQPKIERKKNIKERPIFVF